MKRSSQVGFSMLELLLALALTSVAALLLSETLAQISKFEYKLASTLAELSKRGTPQYQLRNIASLAAAMPTVGGGLEGQRTKASFRFYTDFVGHGALSLPQVVMSVNNNRGWQLKFRTDLQPEVIAYSGDGVAELRYLDQDNEWRATWPARNETGQNNDDGVRWERYRLPKAIQLYVRNHEKAHVYVTFAIESSTLAPPSLEGDE